LAQGVAIMTFNQSVVGSDSFKDVCCFLEQEALHSLLSSAQLIQGTHSSVFLNPNKIN